MDCLWPANSFLIGHLFWRGHVNFRTNLQLSPVLLRQIQSFSGVTMGASSLNQTCIRFGDFELDLQAGVLRKDAILLRCQEQPLQVLAALAERPGELVTREELRRRVWPEDTFVDFDRALNTAIKKIRAALNDDADSPRYIETVPKRGYRLIMPVEQENASLHAHVERFLVTHHRLIALTVIAIIILATLGFAWRFGLWH